MPSITKFGVSNCNLAWLINTTNNQSIKNRKLVKGTQNFQNGTINKIIKKNSINTRVTNQQNKSLIGLLISAYFLRRSPEKPIIRKILSPPRNIKVSAQTNEDH